MPVRISKEALERLKAVDWTPSGRAKRYFDPLTNMEYSTRQVQTARAGGLTNEVAASVGKSGFREIRLAAQARGEKIGRLMESYQWQIQQKTGARPTRKAIANDAQFWNAIRDLGAERSREPTGKKARALVRLGLREPNAPWRVGESPKRRRR